LALPESWAATRLQDIVALAEQRRIGARIDELFAEIAEGEAALAAARKGLDTFRRTLLKVAVSANRPRTGARRIGSPRPGRTSSPASQEIAR
jgi:hypothetical protein